MSDSPFLLRDTLVSYSAQEKHFGGLILTSLPSFHTVPPKILQPELLRKVRISNSACIVYRFHGCVGPRYTRLMRSSLTQDTVSPIFAGSSWSTPPTVSTQNHWVTISLNKSLHGGKLLLKLGRRSIGPVLTSRPPPRRESSCERTVQEDLLYLPPEIFPLRL